MLSPLRQICDLSSSLSQTNANQWTDGGIVLPKRWAPLGRGYIFLSKPKDSKADAPDKSGGKIACIPLQGCKVEFPPGGQRVFREHAHTGARKGYEMAIHVKQSNDDGKMTCFIILDSLGLRETWAAAIYDCDMTWGINSQYCVLAALPPLD